MKMKFSKKIIGVLLSITALIFVVVTLGRQSQAEVLVDQDPAEATFSCQLVINCEGAQYEETLEVETGEKILPRIEEQIFLLLQEVKKPLM